MALTQVRNYFTSSVVPGIYKSKPEAQAAEDVFYSSDAGKAKLNQQKVQDNLAQQILSQGTTSQWSGQGYGSAEANAKAMAGILSGIGITDIRQFGEIKQTVRGDPIYQSRGGDDDAVIVGYGPDKVVTTYGNKVTGQQVPSTYSERQTGNAWGGTFAGKGNTGFRVQFVEGVPYFYTTAASSNDLVNILGDNKLLNIAANVAAAYFGGPAGTAALQAAMGKDVTDIVKGAALTYVGGQIASGVSGAESVIDTLGQAGANIAGKVVGAVATGKDPLTALTTAGFGQTVGESLGLTDTTLATTIGTSLVSGVVADLKGQNVTDAMLAGAVSGYLSNDRKAELAKTAADADMAGGLVPEYGTNDAYDNFMREAMTPEAMTSIEKSIEDNFMLKASDADIAGGLVPEYGTNDTYDNFMQEAMTPEAKASIETDIANASTIANSFDATEKEGSLAKPEEDTGNIISDIFKPMSGSDALKTGLKAALVGGAAVAGTEAVKGLASRQLPIPDMTNLNEANLYKDAPIKGFRMEQDPTTGQYSPYIGSKRLLAKGGFVSRRT